MDREQLEAAISAQESLRGIVADDVINTAVAALRMQAAKVDADARRRRQVTVVFADVSGFTAMAEMFDAEDVTDTINEVWERLDAVVTSHGGRIDKHIGDALMAIWGADTVREDDAEQAVRAALGMQEAMGALRADAGGELRVRVGVNTGPVVLGAVGSQGEFTAMGDAVNLASRLEHAAPVDGVLISHDTYRHVKGVFTVSAQPPIEVKGKRRPVRSYLVEAVRPRAFRLGTRGVEGVETQMVGRDAEIAQLRTLLSNTLLDARLRSVTVVGDAGLGKSRLLYEFEDWLRLQPAEVRLFKARADRQHAGVPHFVIRDLLFTRFEIAEDESPGSAMVKLKRGLTELAPATTDRDVELVATMLGIESGAGSATPTGANPMLAEQMRVALATFVTRVAAEMPVVVLLEDLHWADRSSLDAIEALISRCAESPVFVVALARPALFDRHEPGEDGSSFRIDLVPLGESASRQLVEEVLQNMPHVPESVVDQVSATAAGNPFFVEELVKVMIDDGAIVVDDDEWTVHEERLARARPPSTIASVLQARIDRLPSPERQVLGCAAVIGGTFWDDAILSAGDVADPSRDLSSLLSSLEAKELVFCQSSSGFLGTRQYIFKHAVLQEVMYDLVLKRDRARMHRGVASWLAGRDDSDNVSATIALHYEAAGDATEAAAWRARAGRDAARRWAPRDALPHLIAAREASALSREIRLQVLEDLSGVLTLLGRHVDGVEVSSEMFDVADEVNDLGGQVTALLERSFHLTRLGRLDDALAACEQAGTLGSQASADPVLSMRVLTEQGWVLLRLGRIRQSIDVGMRALALVVDEKGQREPPPDGRAVRSLDLRNAHSQVGAAQHAAGELVAAEHHLQEALRLDKDQHHAHGEAADLINLGVLASTRDDHVLAIGRYEAALLITREIGDVDQEALALNNLGLERISLGEYELATTHLTEALRLFDAANAAEHTSETHCLLARAQLGLGRTERAHAEARRALALAEETGSADHLGNAWLTLGAVAASTVRSTASSDAPEQHDDWIERGITILRKAGFEVGLAQSLRHLADIVGNIGDPVTASELRRLAHERQSRRDSS